MDKMELVGRIGDINPLEHSGGFIFKHPEGHLVLYWVQPPLDDDEMAEHWAQDYTQYFKDEHLPRGELYQVHLNGREEELPSAKGMEDAIKCCGYSETAEEAFEEMLDTSDPQGCAFWWECYASCWGWRSLDDQPRSLSYQELVQFFEGLGVQNP